MSFVHSSVPQFKVEPLNVRGADIVHSPVYTDVRGSLYESFHILKFPGLTSVSSLVGHYPPQGAVYGPVSHSSDELLYLIRGKIFVSIIDCDDFSKRSEFTAEPGMVVRIPAHSIHSFVSVDPSTVFDLVRFGETLCEVHYQFDDPRLAIKWPETGKPLVSVSSLGAKRNLAPIRPRYAIMGANGLIGSSFVREIEARGESWYQLRSRLHMHESIRNELMAIMPSVGVIIAAGVGTRPNTKWCEDHRLETIDANVTSQLAIVKICQDLGLHLTLIGTAGFYHYDEHHKLGSQNGFTEEDAPNHECNFYYQMRVYLENLLNETGAISRVLNLRALFPFNHKVTSASLIGKLLNFKSINCINTSMTVLTSLVPLALDMIKDHDVGHVNWVCQGVSSNGDLLEAYKKIVDPSITINKVEVSQENSKQTGNSAAYIIPARLIAKFGESKVPKLEDSIKHVMELIKAEK